MCVHVSACLCVSTHNVILENDLRGECSDEGKVNQLFMGLKTSPDSATTCFYFLLRL